MNVMDSTGHTKLIWDANKADEVQNARETFEKLTKKGYRAFHVKDNGSEGKQMNGFDPDAEKMIMVPAIVAG